MKREQQILRELRGERIEEEYPSPAVCLRHPRAVWYDATDCPACTAEKEFLALTEKRR
jgi:hypothetical protein